MSQSVDVIMSLKQAANYAKLGMHDMGPRSYRRGQGALLKVIYRFGKDKVLAKDEAKKILNWRGKEVRTVAKKAADNGYITITEPADGFIMTLTALGTEVIEKRLAAEDKAADAVLETLSDDEKKTLLELTRKVSENCKNLGIDYDQIRKRHHKGEGCRRHHHGHAHGPQNVFIFKGEGTRKHGCKHHHS